MTADVLSWRTLLSAMENACAVSAVLVTVVKELKTDDLTYLPVRYLSRRGSMILILSVIGELASLCVPDKNQGHDTVRRTAWYSWTRTTCRTMRACMAPSCVSITSHIRCLGICLRPFYPCLKPVWLPMTVKPGI